MAIGEPYDELEPFTGTIDWREVFRQNPDDVLILVDEHYRLDPAWLN